MKAQENKKLTRKEKKSLKKQNKTQKFHSDKKGVLLNIFLGIIAVILLFNAVSAYNEDLPKTAFSVNVNTSGTNNTSDSTTVVNIPQSTVKPENPVIDENVKPEDTVPDTQDYELSKQEILKVVSDSVNALKADNATFTAHKNQYLSIDLIECSLPAFESIVNMCIDFFEGEEIFEYNFVNGKAFDPEDKIEVTANEIFPPTGKPFTLTDINGVAQAKTEKVGDNTVYTIVLVPETSTLENSKPPYHDSACDTLDFTIFELPVGKITKADLEYPGATVSVTLDKDGRVVGYYERLDMIAYGEGTAMGLTANGKLEGYVDETWKIVY